MKDPLPAPKRDVTAKLQILSALEPLSAGDRQNVMKALSLLWEADRLVPGLLAATFRGIKAPAPLTKEGQQHITAKKPAKK